MQESTKVIQLIKYNYQISQSYPHNMFYHNTSMEAEVDKFKDNSDVESDTLFLNLRPHIRSICKKKKAI